MLSVLLLLCATYARLPISGSPTHKYETAFSPSGATGYTISYENSTFMVFNSSTMDISNEIIIGGNPVSM